MPRAGLTSELRSCPSEVRMAFLNESISAVTCGSPQIVDGFVRATPVTVTPGIGVEAPGVRTAVGGVPMDKVEVGSARKVGVGGGCVAGDEQATNRVEPSRNVKSTLVFIFISSFYCISRQKENARRLIPGVPYYFVSLSFTERNDDHVLV
jgi:hypothetical protein